MKKLILLLLLIPIWGFSQNDKTVKDNQPVSETSAKTEKTIGTVDNANPIYVVDGKITDKDIVEKINVDDIESINILKGEKSVEKYGENGKEGAVEIYLKKKPVSIHLHETLTDNEMLINQIKNSSSSEKVNIRITDIPSKPRLYQPLIIYNNKIISAEEASHISPDSISEIKVLKGNDAFELVGSAGKNGIILLYGNEIEKYDLVVTDIGFESFLKMQPSPESYSISFLKMKNQNYVSVWNSRALSENRDIFENQIDYDSNIFYGLKFEYLLFQYFKFIEHKYSISLV